MFCIIQLIKKSNLSCITTHSKLWRWRHVQTKSLASGRPMHGCQTNTFCEQNYAPRVSIWLLSPGNLMPCYHAAPYRHTEMLLKALHSAHSKLSKWKQVQLCMYAFRMSIHSRPSHSRLQVQQHPLISHKRLHPIRMCHDSLFPCLHCSQVFSNRFNGWHLIDLNF